MPLKARVEVGSTKRRTLDEDMDAKGCDSKAD